MEVEQKTGSQRKPKGYQKTGYLHSDFRLFYLKDQTGRTFDFHYHDFHKLLIFLDGNVSYTIEGRYFELMSGDILLVPAGQIHRPILQEPGSGQQQRMYERIVIYISPHLKVLEGKEDLLVCFEKARQKNYNLIRPDHALPFTREFSWLNRKLIRSFTDQEYEAALYQRIQLLEYLILLNRTLLFQEEPVVRPCIYNQRILDIMHFINSHLTGELDIETIAREFYLTRFHLMHLFKEETGITIGRYITEKRLYTAKNLMDQGASVTDACYQSGFRNYSAFYRAFTRQYQVSPGSFRKR